MNCIWKMVEQNPLGVTKEDWAQTPPAVQNFIGQVLEAQQVQVETQPQAVHTGQQRLEQNSGAGPLENVSQSGEISLGGRVLVVDDNHMNRDMLSRRLQREGHIVEVAVDGRQALELLKKQDFDLVLLDIMMPEINGYEVLERMKLDNTISHIPVIMITAVDELDSIVRCVELGAEDYLPKPFNPILLKARVDASLEKKRLRDQQEAYVRQLNLENQRKSDELEQARKIQLSMLPTKPPAFPYLDIAARQETASEVGGDYYDFFAQANGHLRIALGDATGHGVASGLMVSMTKASLMGAGETDLVMLMQKINRILTEIDLGTQLNMALLLVEVTQRKKGGVRVRASGGGMPPIYILRTTGITEEIMISGLPLGIVAEATYQQTEFALAPGEVILLASDGLPERFNAARQFLGFDRLTAALDQLDTTTAIAAEILNCVASISDDWSQNHPPHDDMTLVVVKVK